MIKKREFKEHNYKAIWFNGKTIRFAINNNKPIDELLYPEFYDIKLTGFCKGSCDFCYMDSKKSDKHYINVISKINNYFKHMSENQRPFQVAIGGGEPTSHPQFLKVLETFKNLGIEPNYTTNGMWVDDDNNVKIIKYTKKYCGGVAVSCHPHLRKYWERAAELYIQHNIKLNFHIIISNKESIKYFGEIYNKWKDMIDYFVLLPYGNQGRAKHKDINWTYLVSNLPKDKSKLAFGANFYSYLQQNNHDINVSLYEPESMSKFLSLEDMSLYPSSFNLTKIN